MERMKVCHWIIGTVFITCIGCGVRAQQHLLEPPMEVRTLTETLQQLPKKYQDTTLVFILPKDTTPERLQEIQNAYPNAIIQMEEFTEEEEMNTYEDR